MIAVALAVAVCALLLAGWALLQVRASEVRLASIIGDDDGGDVARHLARDIAAARTELVAARADSGRALKHVAVVRYDAFGDMAGQLSFSAALVDDAGDGLVISSIHGRAESRTYAKSVEAGASSSELTPEEKQAVAAARAGEGNAR